MTASCPVSVLIPTRNEIANIRDCINSARCCDELVVVDSLSTDGTQAAAASLGATVVDFHWDRHYPKKKNWALANVPWRHDWVFILDADERMTPELAAELPRVMAAPQFDGYYVNRRFQFMGGWIRHCGYYPSWNLRCFKHRLGRYEQPGANADTGSGDNEVHEHVHLQGTSGRLQGRLDHYAYPSIAAWVEKHNRYSNWEARTELAGLDPAAKDAGARLARKRHLRRLAQVLPFRPSARFFYHYVVRAGFLDGYRGYVLCRLMAFYEFLSIAKRREMRAAPPRP